MTRTLSLFALVLASGSTTLFLACSSSSSGAPSGTCDVGGADGGSCMPGVTPAFTSCASTSTPAVSFGKDIQPIFNSSCAFSTTGSCHGSPSLSANDKQTGQIYLGITDGGVDAAQVLMGIVNQPSPENGQMDIVKPGDPQNSYLMHKLDGDQCRFASSCNMTHNPLFTSCGLQMPYNSEPLCLDSQPDCVRGPDGGDGQPLDKQHGYRDQIRRWIAQGAKND